MSSASTIRTCSKIMLAITIIGSLVCGYALMQSYYDYYTFLGLLVMVAGTFSGIMMNALFHGFADIIDNTYAVALKANGVEVTQSVERASGDVSFQQTSKANKEKNDYADELLSKGLISQEEHDNITRDNRNE